MPNREIFCQLARGLRDRSVVLNYGISISMYVCLEWWSADQNQTCSNHTDSKHCAKYRKLPLVGTLCQQLPAHTTVCRSTRKWEQQEAEKQNYKQSELELSITILASQMCPHHKNTVYVQSDKFKQKEFLCLFHLYKPLKSCREIWGKERTYSWISLGQKSQC